MGTKRTAVTLAAMVAVGLFVAGLALWRGWFAPELGRQARTVEVLNARALHRAIQVEPLGASADILEVLSTAPVAGRERVAVTASQHESLLRTASDFLHYRFGQQAPEAYKEWRQRTGHRMRDIAVMKEPWGIERHYEVYFGEPFPENPDLEAIYDRYVKAASAYRGKLDRVSISAEPKGLVVAYGMMSAASPVQPVVSNGLVPDDFWNAGAALTKRRWWNPRLEHPDLLKESGQTPCAVVGVLVEFGDGTRMPMKLTYLWDAKAGGWGLYWLSFSGVSPEDTPGVEY